MNDVFYFGKDGEPGHELRDNEGYRINEHASRFPVDFPCPISSLDTGFLPPMGQEIEGIASHVNLNGWTIISFWDRSADRRPHSNSAFIMRGQYSFKDAVLVAKRAFPQIWERFTFEVKLRT